MEVPVAQYSEKKLKMYEAAEEYFVALKGNNVTKEKLQELKERLDFLSAEYSDNPAYIALMKQKYLEKKVEMEE